MNEPDKYISNEYQPAPFSTVMLAVLSIVRRLIWFFTLTDEDRLKAGIYKGNQGRDG